MLIGEERAWEFVKDMDPEKSWEFVKVTFSHEHGEHGINLHECNKILREVMIKLDF